MQKIISILVENKEWVFSGIGVTIIGAVFGIVNSLFKKRKNEDSAPKIKLSQENYDNSNATQIGIQNNYGGRGDE